MSVFDCCHDGRLFVRGEVGNQSTDACAGSNGPSCPASPSFPIPIEPAILHHRYPNSSRYSIRQCGKSHTTRMQRYQVLLTSSCNLSTKAYIHLPVELLERVCGFLCFHCQAPCYFPNADMEDVVSDKASLARLCRVSKSVCAVAQPFVFHYYATGNLPWYYRDLPTRPGYLYSRELETWPHSNDLLPFFLRSIILRPDLAKCVRSLQLITLHHYVDEALVWNKGPEDDISPAIRKASTDLGLVAYNVFHPGYMRWVREKPDPEDHITISYVHHTLEQLAILLCPRVSTLLLLGNFSPSTGNLLLSYGGTALPALTTIALLSHDNGGHYTHAGPLLALAPNLRTLHAIDVRNNDMRVPPAPDRLSGVAPFTAVTAASASPSTTASTTAGDPRPPPLVFPALQNAALHDLGLAALADFVRGAPALRELRYTETWDEDYGREQEYYWGLAGCLEPARETLRRLVLRAGGVVDFAGGGLRVRHFWGYGAAAGGGAGWVSAAVACGVVYFAG
ncbi:hypothetical protein F5144DRAFT_589585 [Chaetomium tenue]|uniref:Uncharacterized protein n=1 Tax=Chaetomium tenue TaxID=1854479 RepID=A0ACB7PQ57_9PEZI|nr:hypothetical protein F5144DRAFT_589585 [Chaetomium globosum]